MRWRTRRNAGILGLALALALVIGWFRFSPIDFAVNNGPALGPVAHCALRHHQLTVDRTFGGSRLTGTSYSVGIVDWKTSAKGYSSVEAYKDINFDRQPAHVDQYGSGPALVHFVTTVHGQRIDGWALCTGNSSRSALLGWPPWDRGLHLTAHDDEREVTNVAVDILFACQGTQWIFFTSSDRHIPLSSHHLVLSGDTQVTNVPTNNQSRRPNQQMHWSLNGTLEERFHGTLSLSGDLCTLQLPAVAS